MNQSRQILEALRPCHEEFDDDSEEWVGLIEQMPKDDPTLQDAFQIAGQAPTKRNFGLFKNAIQGISNSRAKTTLNRFIKMIENGDYDEEFPRFEGRGSVIAELFSAFRQAVRTK